MHRAIVFEEKAQTGSLKAPTNLSLFPEPTLIIAVPQSKASNRGSMKGAGKGLLASSAKTDKLN